MDINFMLIIILFIIVFFIILLKAKSQKQSVQIQNQQELKQISKSSIVSFIINNPTTTTTTTTTTLPPTTLPPTTTTTTLPPTTTTLPPTTTTLPPTATTTLPPTTTTLPPTTTTTLPPTTLPIFRQRNHIYSNIIEKDILVKNTNIQTNSLNPQPKTIRLDSNKKDILGYVHYPNCFSTWNSRDIFAKCDSICRNKKNATFTGVSSKDDNKNGCAHLSCECDVYGEYKKKYQECKKEKGLDCFIWNKTDAEIKCPYICNKNLGTQSMWSGNWKNLTNNGSCECEFYE